MASLRSYLERTDSVAPLPGNAAVNVGRVNGFAVPSALMDFVHSDKFITIAFDPNGKVTLDVSLRKMLYHAGRMAPGLDGVRRSRAVWVSNTKKRSGEVERAFLASFPESVPDHEAGRRHSHKLFLDGNVECEVWFRVYNRREDVSSMPHASFFIFDELLGANHEVFRMATTRVGLYPDKESGPGCVAEDGGGNRLVWAVSSSVGDAAYWKALDGYEGCVHVTRLS